MTRDTLVPAALLLGLTMNATIATSPTASASELQPRTSAAFDRYASETEAQAAASLASDDRFLWVDRLPVRDRGPALARMRTGGLVIERMQTRKSGVSIEAPGGQIHHWLGTVFVSGVQVGSAVALLRDYDHHADIYGPAVARSRILEQNGDTFRVFIRFFMKKVLTVVVNSEHVARFVRPSAQRAYSRIASIRVAEVEAPDTSGERELAVGEGGGYLWRINSYWRFLERDGGTYVECESITLSRGIPTGLGWLIGPFVTSIPRESLTFTLEKTRDALQTRRPS